MESSDITKRVNEGFKLKGTEYFIHPIDGVDKALAGPEGILGADDKLIPWDIVSKLMNIYKS